MSTHADNQGRLHTIHRKTVCPEEHVGRMHAIITLVSAQEEMDKDATYHALELLREMLPGVDQVSHYFLNGIKDNPDHR